jgi:hypothetical protein
MKPWISTKLWIVALGLGLTGSFLTLDAGTITLDASDLGWYDNAGAHISTNKNYIAGDDGLGAEYRDYFVFDLSGLSGSIISAQLSLYNPCATCLAHAVNGYDSVNPSETYQVTNVTTPVAALEANSAGGTTAIFADLGTNTVYGSQVVSVSDDGQQVVITLDASAIAALNAATGLFAFGGEIVGLPSSPSGAPERAMFINTNLTMPPDVTELILTTGVSEPASWMLTSAGFLVFSMVRICGRRSRVARMHARRI